LVCSSSKDKDTTSLLWRESSQSSRSRLDTWQCAKKITPELGSSLMTQKKKSDKPSVMPSLAITNSS
jgi:hypothetical protein